MMKRLIYTLALLLGSLGVQAQTAQPDLPAGATRYSQTLWIAPDSTLWTGKTGNYIRVADWHDVDSLFGLGYTKVQVDSVLQRNYYTKPEVDSKFTLGPKSFNIIGSGNSDAPIITTTEGDWDESIREIGNVIFDYDLNKYFFVYTGYSGGYAEGNVYIGLAESTDGNTWTKLGQITPIGHEDPYLLKIESEYYLYTEKKQNTGQTHLGVNLFKGFDINNLTDLGVVLENGTGWEAQDVSSPTVLFEGNVFYLFYEGRGPSQLGAIGLATSSDGINFTKSLSNPIANGKNMPDPNLYWASHIVPDDIIKLDGQYYMMIHGYNSQVFAAGLMTSTDLVNWFEPLGSWINTGKQNNNSNGSGISLYLEQNKLTALYLLGGKEIYKGYFSVKTGESGAYNVMSSSVWVDIYPAGRSSYIDLTNPSAGYLISNDPNSGAGIVKTLRNLSGAELTVNPDTGVLIDGTTSGFTVPIGESVRIVSTSTNEWSVWPYVSNYMTTNTNQTITAGKVIAPSVNFNEQAPYGTTIGRIAAGSFVTGADNTGSVGYTIRGYSASGIQLLLAKGGIQSAGVVLATGFSLSALNTPPSSATATGTAGEIRFGTDGRIYICTATNTWIRSDPLTTW